MIWMSKMENIVMNLTGCERQIANTVINTILEEDRKANSLGENEWISVEERLPKKEQIVLCCLGLVQNVYTYKGDSIWEDSYGYYQKDEPITHWMPLPDAPKGGEE